jgi:hypothetical protein
VIATGLAEDEEFLRDLGAAETAMFITFTAATPSGAPPPDRTTAAFAAKAAGSRLTRSWLLR